MRNRNILIFLSIALLSIATSIYSKDKIIDITKTTNSPIGELRVRSSLSTADTCTVRHDLGLYWQIGNWIQGNELYKSYLDPSLTCANPYPYSVTDIIMPLYFKSASTITLSVDIEKVDYTNPSCPFPDTIMLALSSTWSYSIPGEGYWNLVVPFDQPVVVNEPFFAGFFIGEIDSNNIPSILTDSNSQSICMSYNVWDDSTVFNDSVSFIDLMDSAWGFPGQLVLYATGVPGGGPSDPAPAVTILSPKNNENKYKSTEIWVYETSGSPIIDYVSFAYAIDTNFIEIGRDYDGTKAFRDGVNPSNNATGYNIDWDFSGVAEGTYTIRVTSVDTLGRTAIDEISLFLEPTPPVAEIISPSFEAIFCPTFDILMSSTDENLNAITLYYQRSEPNYSINAQTLLMSDFGNYYSSAIVASLALQALDDRGIYNIMQDRFGVITPTQMANILADYFLISTNNGVYDENIFSGLQEFNTSVGSYLLLDYMRFPDYLELRTEIELNGNVAMAGLGGTSNNWVLINGFYGTKASDGTYKITISNPLNAQIDTVQLKNAGGGSEIFYNGNWQSIDIVIFIGTGGWDNQLTSFGFDIDRTNGWSYQWTPPILWQNYDYFIQSKGIDQTGLNGYNTTMLSYDCTQFYLAGDLNNDGLVDINDFDYIIDYFTNQGPPPVGGDGRADTNCDGYLNITDIIYYANFIFGTAPTPCY